MFSKAEKKGRDGEIFLNSVLCAELILLERSRDKSIEVIQIILFGG